MPARVRCPYRDALGGYGSREKGECDQLEVAGLKGDAGSAELLREAQAGDRAAFGRVLDKYSGRLLNRIRMLLGPEGRTAAESGDFLQGVFVEALRDFDRRGLQTEKGFLRWLTAIARNNVRDAVRRPREAAFESFSDALLHTPRGASGDEAIDMAVRREEELHLLECLEELSEDRRLVVELRSLRGLSFGEVADRMKRKVDAVRMLHARALVELARLLRTSD